MEEIDPPTISNTLTFNAGIWTLTMKNKGTVQATNMTNLNKD
jgi:hypothetical protein